MLAVGRQETEIRELIASDGRTEPVLVYTDNDITAAGKKKRPEYERMVADIRAGRVSAVYAWKSDRVIRKMQDLLDFMEACGSKGGPDARVPFRTVRSGHYDFHTASGKMLAQILTSVAEYEINQAVERIQSKTRQRREAGEYYMGSKNGGGWCHFVYEQNGDGTLRVNQLAAEQYLSEVRRLLAAGPGSRLLRTFARERNEKDIRPLISKRGTGKWVSSTVKASLMSSTPAAVNETPDYTPSHRMDYSKRVWAADGNWPAVTDYDTVLAVRRILLDPEHLQQYYGREPVHLLTGVLECGECGQRAFCWHKAHGKMPDRYVCKSADRKPGVPGAGYCVTHRAGQLDEYITGLVLNLACQPGVIGKFSRPKEDTGPLEDELNHVRSKLARAARMWADDKITDSMLTAMKAELEPRAKVLQARIAAATPPSDGDEILEKIRRGEHPFVAWEEAAIGARRRSLAKFIDHITILKSAKRGRPAGISPKAPWPFDPGRVHIEWQPDVWGAMEDHPELKELVLGGAFFSYATSTGGVWQPGEGPSEAFAAELQSRPVRTEPGSSPG